MRFWSVAVCLLVALCLEVRAGVLARFKMNNDLGTIDVELYDLDKPATVSNFVSYVKSGAWHDCAIHRWAPNFVLQGGSRNVPHDSNLLTPLSTARGFVTSHGGIPFERDLGRHFSNIYGTIAMARVGADTGSASTDWFFNLNNNTSLDTQDGGYTVFASVLRGTNILNRLQRPSGSTNIYVLNDGSLNPSTPVYSADGANGFWLNVDITLLTAEIARNRSGYDISWTSVEGRPNIVEFTRAIPAVWQTVQTVTGTGARMTVTDNPGADTMRQYRVRIDYTN